MFRGISQISLDAKHRIAIPARYRDQLMESCGGQLVVTVDRGGCLLVYPMNEWEVIERQLMSLPNFNNSVRKMQRLFLGHATETEMSDQGRLVIPEPLREFAKIGKQVVLVGQGNKFELWSAEAWQAEMEEAIDENEDEDFQNLMGSISL